MALKALIDPRVTRVCQLELPTSVFGVAAPLVWVDVPVGIETTITTQWTYASGVFSPPPPLLISQVNPLDTFRESLPTIFAGTPAQQMARYLVVLKQYPPVTVLLFALRGPVLTPAQSGVVQAIAADVKGLIGTVTAVLTATEYLALQTLATANGLGALIP